MKWLNGDIKKGHCCGVLPKKMWYKTRVKSVPKIRKWTDGIKLMGTIYSNDICKHSQLTNPDIDCYL